MSIGINSLECQTHNGSPIMFICLDNLCTQKLYCFKCCQQYRKEHNFVKYSDFMHNLETYLHQGDFSQHKINSTQLIEGEAGEKVIKKDQKQDALQRKPSLQDDDTLITQCVKGVNQDLRKGKVWEECEQAKDDFKNMQTLHIEQIFDKHVQEIHIMLEKAREQIISKYSEYIENVFSTEATLSKALDNKALKEILEINKLQSNNYQHLNDNLSKLHSGQLHVQFQKEKITNKIGELNHKLDEFFAQVQNRITFGLNSCNQVFQPKQVNAAAAAVIQKIFAQNQIPRHQPGDFRFSLRHQANSNKMFQSQFTQQPSLLNSGQSSTLGGLSSRISFRIKNIAQKKLDNFFSVSPPAHQQQINGKQCKTPQGAHHSPNKPMRQQIFEINQNSKQISPKTQQVGLFKGIGKSIKQSTFNSQESSKGEEELLKLQASQQKDDQIIIVSQDLKQNGNDGTATFQQPLPSTKNPIIIIQKSEILKNQNSNPQRYEGKPNQTIQLFSSQNQEGNTVEDYFGPKTIVSPNSCQFSSSTQSTKQQNQVKTLKKSPKNLNLINNKLGFSNGEGQTFNDDFQFNSQEEENSKTQDKHRYANAQVDISHNLLCVDHINKFAILKQTNQIKNVVESQKQLINQMNSKENNSHIIKLSETQMQQQSKIQMSTLFPEETQESQQDCYIEDFQDERVHYNISSVHKINNNEQNK